MQPSIRIEYSSNFTKQYRKLSQKTKIQFQSRQQLFIANPSSAQLHDHALTGKYRGYRSLNITGDIRALYITRDNVVIIFAFIGSHSQLYGK